MGCTSLDKLLTLTSFTQVDCTYSALQLKILVCLCQTVLFCPYAVDSLYKRVIEYIFLGENFIYFPLSSLLAPSLVYCCRGIYCPRFCTILISYFSSIKCSNRLKKLPLFYLQRLDSLWSWFVVYIMSCSFIARTSIQPENFRQA